MSEPIYLTPDDGVARWVEWHANSATHIALPAAEMRALLAERDALRAEVERLKAGKTTTGAPTNGDSAERTEDNAQHSAPRVPRDAVQEGRQSGVLGAEPQAHSTRIDLGGAPTPQAMSEEGCRCGRRGCEPHIPGGCAFSAPPPPDLRALIDEWAVASALFATTPRDVNQFASGRMEAAERALADAARKGAK